MNKMQKGHALCACLVGWDSFEQQNANRVGTAYAALFEFQALFVVRVSCREKVPFNQQNVSNNGEHETALILHSHPFLKDHFLEFEDSMEKRCSGANPLNFIWSVIRVTLMGEKKSGRSVMNVELNSDLHHTLNPDLCNG
ncbi:hypothetical protein AT251_08955 [Enterovibrio nigricans]|nr:hypothetical protein [Enterovibrio nigricans]PKF50777.1 hypothetical protein AT251_08955 [Enterovibrio nigricans]